METRRGATKRRRSKFKPLIATAHRHRHSNPGAVVVATLAALKNLHCDSSESLLKSTLNKLLRLLSTPSPPLSADFLNLTVSLLSPLLSNSRHHEIVSVGARIVGAASLISFEMNEKIASDGEIVRALVPKVVSSQSSVAVAACDAILDLSTTALGRKRLLEMSVLEYLMNGFLQVYISSRASISIFIVDKGGVPCLGVEGGKDELLQLLLSAAVTLVNSCSIEYLEEAPKKLVESFVVHLKEIWAEVRAKVLAEEVMNTSQTKERCVSNFTASNLAESLFRLSMNASCFAYPMPTEVIVEQIFGSSEYSFMNFLLNHWELSPFILRKPESDSGVQGDIFRTFMQLLNGLPSSLTSLLKGMVSCIPIGADDTDILNFLKEAGETLGCPLIYEQDIRVLRTCPPDLKTEEHYFKRSFSVKSHNPIYINDIIKCVDAYKLRYTLAMRGMEFRCMSIAAIADKLAYLFGQPSVGANLYLTPPNSQGLACHYDDHCVFVCQLWGTKQWTVFSEPIVELPRLYQHVKHQSVSMTQSKQIILQKGDVLYIPRGVYHEASTPMGRDCPDGSADFSLHITLAVEIEPPFEWEGFAHIALFCWSRNLNASEDLVPCLPARNKMHAISISFLHVSIGLLGNCNPVFRKACLVAADSSNSDTKYWLDQNQMTIFNQLIDRIYEESNFRDALNSIQTSVQKCEDPFHRIRWLSLLIEKETVEHDWLFPFEGIDMLLPLINERINEAEAEAAFTSIKSKFCREVIFDDVKERFKMLHGMYKKTRAQYMNGMLSLHF